MLLGTPALHDAPGLHLLLLGDFDAATLCFPPALHCSLLFLSTRLENEGCTRLLTHHWSELLGNFWPAELY